MMDLASLAEAANDPAIAMECHERTWNGIRNGCMGCGACCGRVLPMTSDEEHVLKEYVAENGVKPERNAYAYCCLLDIESGLCKAYEARPLICRSWDSPSSGHALYGTKPNQPCGARVDMLKDLQANMRKAVPVDTWGLFGLE